MSFEVEYKLFNGRSKKQPDKNLKIDQTPILNSIVNTYALSLFVGKFYDFSKENDLPILKRLVDKERDKQTENLWMKFAKFVVKTKI